MYSDILPSESAEEILDIAWDEEGKPWFNITSGYILAEKSDFSVISEEIFAFSDGLEAEALDFMTEIFNINEGV